MNQETISTVPGGRVSRRRSRKYEGEWEPVIVPISEIPKQPIEWLWPGKIPQGKISVLAGDPNLGKSFVALDVAARVSAGLAWPDESQKPEEFAEVSRVTGDVLLLSAEDDAADTIRPRLEVAGADPRRIHVVRGMRQAGEGSGTRNSSRSLVSLEEDVEWIASALLQNSNYKLVVIDPISAYLDGLDPNSNNEVRWLLSRLKQIAEESRVAMLLVSHLRKSSGYSPAVYRTMGSLAFTAVARALWTILKDPGDPTRRLLLPVKLNLIAQPLGLAFRLSATGRVEWDPQPLALDADERVQEAFSELEPEDRLKQAKRWLRGILDHGRQPSNEIKLGNLGGEGFAVAGTTFTGNINSNLATDNSANGFDVNINTITGDFINNRADDNLGGAGIGITSDTFTGLMAGNGATANSTQGFNLNITTFNGDFTLNSASDNLGGQGMALVGTNFNGNVTSNFSTRNATSGMDFNVNTFIGNFSNNISDSNLGGEGVLLTGVTFSGNIEDNFTNLNATKGFSMNFTTVNTDFLRNTADGNLAGEGFDLNATTFTGVIEANTANSNVGVGLSVNAVDFIGEIRDNTVTLNTAGGFVVNVTNELTGNIIRNIADQNGVFGFDIDVVTYTGNLESNIAANATANGFGFDVTTTTFEGTVLLNTASNNTNIGLRLVADDFTGDFTLNNASDNTVGGINLAITNTFTGNIFENTANDNTVAADGFTFSTTDLVGDFSDNIANFNDSNGYNITIDTLLENIEDNTGGNIVDNTGNSNNNNGFLVSIATVDVTEDFAGAAFSNNIAINNSDDGINLTISKSFTGIIENNQTDNNTNNGLVINAVNFTGDITGNTANLNRDSGMIVNVTDTYNGTFTNNTANENRDFGYFLTIDRFMDDSDDTGDQIDETGEFSGNTANLNSDEGFVLDITGAKDSGLRILNNTFLANDITLLPVIAETRDVLVTFNGTGTLLMILDGNVSIPVGTQLPGFITDATILNDPTLQLNYDIQNTSTGSFLLLLGTNLGNVGNNVPTSPVIQFLP